MFVPPKFPRLIVAAVKSAEKDTQKYKVATFEVNYFMSNLFDFVGLG